MRVYRRSRAILLPTLIYNMGFIIKNGPRRAPDHISTSLVSSSSVFFIIISPSSHSSASSSVSLRYGDMSFTSTCTGSRF